jgi:hypothetical protein
VPAAYLQEAVQLPEQRPACACGNSRSTDTEQEVNFGGCVCANDTEDASEWEKDTTKHKEAGRQCSGYLRMGHACDT